MKYRLKNSAAYLVILAAAALTVVLAGTMDAPDFHRGEPFPRELFTGGAEMGGLMDRFMQFAREEIDEGDWDNEENEVPLSVLLVPLVLALGVLLGVLFIAGRQLKKAALIRLLLIFLAAALSIFLFFSSMNASPAALPELPDEPAAQDISRSVESDGQGDVPGEIDQDRLGVFLIILLSFALASSLFFAVRWIAFSRPRSKPPSLQEAALRAQTGLNEGRDSRSVIIRCYDEMSSAILASAGLSRMQSMTAGEFRDKLVQEGLPSPAVSRLTGLFEMVRYGRGNLSEKQEKEAVDALEDIVAALNEVGVE